MEKLIFSSQKFYYSKKGKADLHIHSHYSRDALSSLKAILKKAKEENLNLIAITDHNTIKGAKEAQKMAVEFGLEVIIGEEIDTREGDIIGLFIKELILPQRPILEVIKEIHQQGGLAIVPHPNNWFVDGISTKMILKIFEHLDGIEFFNGAWLGRTGFKKFKKNEELNKLLPDLALVGGSDAHLANQVGCAFTLFPGQNSNDLYTSIKDKLTSVGGTGWTYKNHLKWLIQVPRIFYKYPKLPVETAQCIIKKIVT